MTFFQKFCVLCACFLGVCEQQELSGSSKIDSTLINGVIEDLVDNNAIIGGTGTSYDTTATGLLEQNYLNGGGAAAIDTWVGQTSDPGDDDYYYYHYYGTTLIYGDGRPNKTALQVILNVVLGSGANLLSYLENSSSSDALKTALNDVANLSSDSETDALFDAIAFLAPTSSNSTLSMIRTVVSQNTNSSTFNIAQVVALEIILGRVNALAASPTTIVSVITDIQALSNSITTPSNAQYYNFAVAYTNAYNNLYDIRDQLNVETQPNTGPVPVLTVLQTIAAQAGTAAAAYNLYDSADVLSPIIKSYVTINSTGNISQFITGLAAGQISDFGLNSSQKIGMALAVANASITAVPGVESAVLSPQLISYALGYAAAVSNSISSPANIANASAANQLNLSSVSALVGAYSGQTFTTPQQGASYAYTYATAIISGGDTSSIAPEATISGNLEAYAAGNRMASTAHLTGDALTHIANACAVCNLTDETQTTGTIARLISAYNQYGGSNKNYYAHGYAGILAAELNIDESSHILAVGSVLALYSSAQNVLAYPVAEPKFIKAAFGLVNDFGASTFYDANDSSPLSSRHLFALATWCGGYTSDTGGSANSGVSWQIMGGAGVWLNGTKSATSLIDLLSGLASEQLVFANYALSFSKNVLDLIPIVDPSGLSVLLQSFPDGLFQALIQTTSVQATSGSSSGDQVAAQLAALRLLFGVGNNSISMPSGPYTQFVIGLYQTLLNRAPDINEIRTAVTSLADGEKTQVQVVTDLINTEEFVSHSNSSWLDFQNFSGFLHSNGTTSIDSSEFNSENFLKALYKNSLQRSAEQMGLYDWQQKFLSNGTVEMDDVAAAVESFLTCSEFQANIAPKIKKWWGLNSLLLAGLDLFPTSYATKLASIADVKANMTVANKSLQEQAVWLMLSQYLNLTGDQMGGLIDGYYLPNTSLIGLS